jgi:hypothetical protein
MPEYQVVADQRPLMVRLAARVADAGRLVPDWRGGAHQGRSVNEGLRG